MTEWTCQHCQSQQTHDAWCEVCAQMRYPSFAIQFAHHITEHLADGVTEPLAMLEAMQARPCYRKMSLTLAFVAQQVRLLTKDTTTIARDLLKARAARLALEASEPGGDRKNIIQVLKGIQVLGDVVEHKGEVTTRFVVETHEGSPPKS